MDLSNIGDLIGGLGLFLLGMQLMTNGLKRAAGQTLRKALEAATRSRIRGLISGTAITALVQSSSAVTVATIGFVNAGLLNLGQSVAVIYGCNIGTTMTGWLVATIGFNFKISAFALPMIGLGVVMSLIGGEKRYAHMGTSLTGFGLFFIGLSFLKGTFHGLENSIPFETIGATSYGLALFVLAGFVMTVLIQSSSAAMAITLSMASTGAIPLAAAGALVIGANLGTTSTAALSVIGATSNAKRIACAHVFFNLITGAVGLLLLISLAGVINRSNLNQTVDMVILLALFHTLFNVVGVIIMWPVTTPMVAFLETRFRRGDEDQAKARFLDKNILETPPLAIEAMTRELSRVSRMASTLAKQSLSAELSDSPHIRSQSLIINKLIIEIGTFSQKLGQQPLSEEISQILPSAMRVARYFNEMARLSGLIVEYSERFNQISDSNTQKDIYELKKITNKMLNAAVIDDEAYQSSADTRKVLFKLEKKYQKIKQHILEAMIEGRLSPDEGTNLLDSLSHIHRLGLQAEKSSRYWSSLSPVEHRSPIIHHAEESEPEEESKISITEAEPEDKNADKSADQPVTAS
ncbi:phosphate:Na+ symporter [Amphritea atlantica]|uniref:Phosphate:Na+ symporter n=1 Tax=Amphritea atlantica TaxID=355243 RepID=A0A1H9HKA2_9GAMM|nr:Na/Pi cotransporter family protein [Amphritea atlantica]SEQ62727.1 phosphate:Na+ symporter [Amphritea atlantica]